jgi:hypothetical protein
MAASSMPSSPVRKSNFLFSPQSDDDSMNILENLSLIQQGGQSKIGKCSNEVRIRNIFSIAVVHCVCFLTESISNFKLVHKTV